MVGRAVAWRMVLCAMVLFELGTVGAAEPASDTRGGPVPPAAHRVGDHSAAGLPAVIPLPVAMDRHEGEFQITAATVVAADTEAVGEATKLIDALAPAMGFRLKQVTGETPNAGAIVLAIDDSLRTQLGVEGYTLHVTQDRIDLRAAQPAGLFYGIQTLRQLLPVAAFSKEYVENIDWTVPCVTIQDHARFPYRGLLIDPARHFIPVADVKHFIDAMALHKFNHLQMHLTDNEGWRIEILKYPKLTEIGSQMDWNLRHRGGDGPRCFGFYTQDEIRELVRYAAERHVTIVPEIEMPYHAGSAIVAYPEHGVNTHHLADEPIERRWGPSQGLLGARPETVSFMQDVLKEVIGLFPSRFIHIGGDEANLRLWTDDPEMQEMMKQLGCDDAHELHSWFIAQMDAYLTKHGRRMIGWDEILQGGLAPGATVMSWRGTGGGIAAAQAGHDVIMTPTSHTYFDYRQHPDELGLGRAVLTWEQVYSFEPVPGELDADQARHVLGGQGQLWGELIADGQRRDFMTWPRACALIETLWSPKEHRHSDLFLLRLDTHLKRLLAAEIGFRRPDQRAEVWEGKFDPESPRAARALLERLLPDQTERFTFEAIAPEAGRDVFEIETVGGQVVIRGNTGVSMALGLNWYLKHLCHCHVSWGGDQLNLPDPLPEVRPKLRQVSWAKHRYFLNYCCFGYSLPWWDWAQWERLIDWMALNGITAPLAVTGQEAVWQAVGKQLGLDDEQIGQFLAGPPYLPFGWMGCLDGWGGPLPQDWIDRHAELGKKILSRQRELGMTPVLQGFTGHVPAAVAEKYPEAKLHEIQWIEWTTQLLDPLDPLFGEIAERFMVEQTRRFGADHLYAADTFIEMTPPSGELEYLSRLSRAIYDGMAKTDPQAVWVLQGWAFMYKQAFWTQPRIEAFLGAVPDDRMLVLDLFCESTPMWSRTEAFFGKPWLWCNVQNFGGTVHLGGALDRNNAGLNAARRDPNRGRLSGLGFVNEGLGYNPVAYDLMFEMAWRDALVDLPRWIRDYSRHRYGKTHAEAETAWAILLDTVYTAPHRTRSIIDQVPSWKPAGGSPYDQVQLADAWRRLLLAAEELGDADTYRFDLVNVARQVLSHHAAVLHRKAVQARQSGDVEAFQAAANEMLQLMRDLDQLLATRPEFLLGRWLEDAKRWGTNDAERAKHEWNARRVLTLWGTGRAIRDYARKEWSGMIGGFYLPRWERFLREEAEAMADGRSMDADAFAQKLWQWEHAWADGQETYATEPVGDSIEQARGLWQRYAAAFQPDSPSLTTGKPVACSSSLPPYPARLANDGFASNTDRYWATDVGHHPGPAWWQVDLQEPTMVGRVVVVGYYGDRRHYGFTLETSLDGQTWESADDRRDNKELATSEGYTSRFAPRPVRYLRVTQTSNSANTGRHLVEVMAFPK
ncbi:MAG: family 20 glycosylhydrolase [Pirellulaceae bacterium]|nr:family 20 glycosylhydrolase [Pirellulaceae bacterium]